MTARTLKLLHVEDDAGQRLLTKKMLATLPEFTFEITAAESEAAAVAEFQREAADFVLLDYQLDEGNGLSCLKQLRRLDPVVPIVAISGMATPEIAAELIHAGADDYLTKDNLTADGLAISVRASLTRVDGYRRRVGNDAKAAPAEIDTAFRNLSHELLAAFSPDLLATLDAFEELARTRKLSNKQLERLFDAVCSDLDGGVEHSAIRRRLRPVWLELMVRFHDEPVETRAS